MTPIHYINTRPLFRWAGTIADEGMKSHARQVGLYLFYHLRRHNVIPCLQRLGDIIRTEAAGTNVNDLKIMVIMPPDEL